MAVTSRASLVGLVVGVIVGFVLALAGFGSTCNAECGPNADYWIFAAMIIGGLIAAASLGRLTWSLYDRHAARTQD